MIHATHQVVLDVCIKTVAGKTIIRNVLFHVIQEPLLDLLIGVEVLEMLGISPLQILIEKQHEGFGKSICDRMTPTLQKMTLRTKVIL